MSARLLILSLLLVLLCASNATAQCTIGVAREPFADPGGLMLPPAEGEEFSLFVVMSARDAVNGVGYRMEVTAELGSTLFLTETLYGPQGVGIALADGSPAGDDLRVGLGECAAAYSQFVVAEYRFLRTALFHKAEFRIQPLLSPRPPDESSSAPIYSTCDNLVVECPESIFLTLEDVPTEPKSLGAVKSLYTD